MDRALYRNEFERLADIVFKFAGEYDAEMLFTAGSNALTRFANNVIHQNVATDSGNISVRLQKGMKTGTVSIGLFADKDIIAAMIKKAIEIVEHGAENHDLMPILEPQEYEEVDGFSDDTAKISPAERADIVGKAIRECEKNSFSAAGNVRNGATAIGIANSKGLRAFWAGTDFAFGMTVEGQHGTGWAACKSWAMENINTDNEIGEAIEIAHRNQNPRDVEPGKYTVILTPAAVADLTLFMTIHGFNARAHLEKHSFLTGKIGEKVFSEKLKITDDAYDPRWASLPFDLEGMPRRKVQLVESGILGELVYDRLTAKKMNTDPTGHGLQQPNQWGAFASNLVIAPGDVEKNDLIKSVKKGLLVTHFHYTNVSELTKLTITGMTRDGLFMIENGEIAYPVKNLRFTQSVAEAMNNIVAIGKEQKLVSGFFFGGAIVPGMIIENFNFSSGTGF